MLLSDICYGTRGRLVRDAPSNGCHPPFTIHHEECDALLNRCFKRICGWRVPPNWSAVDWREEIRAHGLAAACEASCEFDASRRVPPDAFVYQRVIARAYTRFRQEWAYGLRCLSETCGVVTDGGHVSLHSKSRVQCRESSVEPDPFNYPQSLAAMAKPSAMSVRRAIPLHMTVFPGGESLARPR